MGLNDHFSFMSFYKNCVSSVLSRKCQRTIMLEITKVTRATIAAAGVSNAFSPQTEESTGATVIIEIQETAGTTETSNTTCRMREVAKTNMRMEVKELGRKTPLFRKS